MKKPLMVDLYAGLGGWSEGFIAEGYECIGFDIERHKYSTFVEEFARPCGDGWETASQREIVSRYPGQLVLQDVATIHGSQFKDAACIMASPPCQNYSYLAMPWSRSTNPNNSKAAKTLRLKWETEGPDNRLFDACFRIQREACEAAGRYIPLIVENVRGAQPWVGRSAWNYGSFHLWGDVPALMPINMKRGSKVPGFRFDGSGGSFQTASVEHAGVKVAGLNWSNYGKPGYKAEAFNGTAEKRFLEDGRKVPAYSDPRRNGGKGVHLTSPHENSEGLKIGGDWFSDPNSTCMKHGSRSQARKAASAQIAKIPLPLSTYLAQVFKPR